MSFEIEFGLVHFASDAFHTSYLLAYKQSPLKSNINTSSPLSDMQMSVTWD